MDRFRGDFTDYDEVYEPLACLLPPHFSLRRNAAVLFMMVE